MSSQFRAFSWHLLFVLACRTTDSVGDTKRLDANDPDLRAHHAPSSLPAVTFHREGDSALAITVEVAADEAAHARGLMFRKSLDPMRGMLFVFDREDNHAFWMKNTLIPLDMIFVDSDHRVVGIVASAKPHDETSRGVGRPSRYVVEVNGGFSEKHRIRVGSRVTLQMK